MGYTEQKSIGAAIPSPPPIGFEQDYFANPIPGYTNLSAGMSDAAIERMKALDWNSPPYNGEKKDLFVSKISSYTDKSRFLTQPQPWFSFLPEGEQKNKGVNQTVEIAKKDSSIQIPFPFLLIAIIVGLKLMGV